MEHKKTKQKTATLNRAHREACACASPGPRRPRNAPASAEPARWGPAPPIIAAMLCMYRFRLRDGTVKRRRGPPGCGPGCVSDVALTCLSPPPPGLRGGGAPPQSRLAPTTTIKVVINSSLLYFLKIILIRYYSCTMRKPPPERGDYVSLWPQGAKGWWARSVGSQAPPGGHVHGR